MTTALVHRSLIGMTHCPYCDRVVYLGDCDPQEGLNDIHLEHVAAPIEPHYARWWECAHQGPGGTTHQWAAVEMIELRPVTALHVQVVSR